MSKEYYRDELDDDISLIFENEIKENKEVIESKSLAKLSRHIHNDSTTYFDLCWYYEPYLLDFKTILTHLNSDLDIDNDEISQIVKKDLKKQLRKLKYLPNENLECYIECYEYLFLKEKIIRMIKQKTFIPRKYSIVFTGNIADFRKRNIVLDEPHKVK